ncbi:MAG: prolyl oligopeptidase family serine peptidase [Rhodothermales bacterium]
MRFFRGAAIGLFVLALAHPTVLFGQSDRRPLDHDAYDVWNRITSRALSNDGRWALHTLAPEDGDSRLVVDALDGNASHTIPFADNAAFTEDAQYVAFLIKPPLDSVRAAKRAGKKGDDLPRDDLGLLDTATGAVVRIPGVTSYKLPEKAAGWVAYLLADAPEASPDSAKTDTTAAKPSSSKKERQAGKPLVLRRLETADETVIDDVLAYAFSPDGRWLAAATETKDGSHDGLSVIETATGVVTPILAGPGDYEKPVFDKAGEQLAFLSNRDDFDADQPGFTLYRWTPAGGVEALAAADSAGMPADWWVSVDREPAFSESGSRLLFGTAPRPAPEPEEEPLDEEQPRLDVWNWRDPLLQPMQLVQRDRELKRAYTAVVLLEARRIVQLGTAVVPDVTVGDRGDADVAIGLSDIPYRQLVSWDDSYYDAYLIDVGTGRREMVAMQIGSRAALSPAAKYVYWWDGKARHWFGRSVEGGRVVNLTAGIPFPVDDETNDRPMAPSPYGSAGWSTDDAAFLVYDKNDVWSVDPDGQDAPVNLTAGLGREAHLRLRAIRLDPDMPAVDLAAPILLSAFDETTKDGGFYRLDARKSQRPAPLVMGGWRFGTPVKARDAERLLYSRENFGEFPDLWASNLSLGDPRKVSDANPQQAGYRWGTAELVSWTSNDGLPLEGILYKPEDFDPSKKYPMMVYFYERMSDNLNAHNAPATSRSSINFTFYASRGYLVFVPDIVYRIGYPGESALNAVIPGVTSLIAAGFVDPERIGVQGHSWGGYQIAYMITETNIFRAAEAGAPVSNMTSAYGGIRWETGMSRMFQYERTQSRIGGTLWDYPLRYIDNSPLFQADKIETPLLMMHNDADGAVPWYQGIEFFVALRRLGKPVWMLNYNGEPHGLQKYPNKRDFAIRMQQFFDHYLLDAPEPAWMSEGIPATMKGKTLGLELETAK